MGARAEISWNRLNDVGAKVQVYAHRTGDKWDFFIRHRRFDNWVPHVEPTLEDWMELLDGVTRRAQRRLQKPQEIERIKKLIREKFPAASID